MPKQGRSKASSKPKAFVSKKRIASDDDSEHDADSSAKRLKTDYVRPKGMQKDDEGSPYWELSQYRRVGVSEFKGKTYVNVREYYSKGDKMLPGKKGISLNAEQLAVLAEIMPDLQREFNERNGDAETGQSNRKLERTGDKIVKDEGKDEDKEEDKEDDDASD